MSENKGFKNCPSITEFKVGMCVRERTDKYTGEWFTVAIVLKNGSPVSERATQFPFSSRRHICDFELDLSSVWEGRQYRDKQKGWKAKVLLVGSEAILLETEGGVLCPWRANTFAGRWEPLPLGEPAENAKPGFKDIIGLYEDKDEKPPEPWKPTSAAGMAWEEDRKEQPTETWKPKVGWPCLHVFGCAPEATQKVTPLAYDDEECVWVCSKFGEPGYVGIPEGQLFPLPPEPTVKVGDYAVHKEHPEKIGQIAEVNTAEKRTRFCWSTEWIEWDKLTKLVPAQESPDAR